MAINSILTYFWVRASVLITMRQENIYLFPYSSIYARTFQTQISLLFRVKAGYSIGSKNAYNKVSTGAYFNPTFGVRFILNRQSAMNIAFGYNLQQQIVKKDIYYNDNFFIYTGVYHHRLLRHALSLRLGVDF